MSGTKAFHPQGRLPLDPFNIIGADTSLGGANAEKEQSQRKSGWTVKERNVQDIWTRHKFEQGKVILVLGVHVEPTAKDLGPLLNSQLLSNSLLILATQRPPSELPLIIPKSTSQGPALLILRLQPLSHPIPQQTHSILSRAEIFARKWRQDRKSVFFEPEEERGRSRFGRNSKSKSDEVQLKALQLSEIGGVFGRDFDVREEIGSNSNIIPSPPPSSSSNRTKSYLRAPVFTSTSISRKNLEHRAFDAVINFVPAGFHEESHESVFMKSISSVSSASRAFLTPPVPTSSSFSGRGRSMSKGSRGRSSSLDRIRDWVRSRSRSKTRNDENSEKPIRSSGNMKTNSVGFGKHRNTNEPRKTDPSAGLSSRKGEGTVQRSEHDVLTSWSRNQLQQANCDSRVWSNSDSSLEYSRSAESKAYLIHVLPLPPPTPAPALLQTSFSRGRLSMPRSQSSSGSVLSSVDTEIPPLGARHNTSKELKNGGVSHTVPPAQKPVSVESSMAVSLNALTHSRSGSLNSTALFSLSSSLGSSPPFRDALLLGNESTKIPSTLENPALIEGTSFPDLQGSNLVVATSSREISPSAQSKLSVNRRASLISPALEAAVESATRHSLRAGRRVLSPSKSSTDTRLQRRSTAIQVASAAAIAALEVNLSKAYEHHSTKSRDINETSTTDLQLASEENTGERVEGKNNSIESENDPNITHSRRPFSTGIPEVLMPHPHRQSSLVLHDSVFDPLDVDALFQIDGPASDEAHPTPLSLLPRPHARARTQSLDGPACSPTKFDTSSRVSVALPQTPPPLSIPPTDPNFYYEKNHLIQELEQFALSYSYVSSSSSVAPTSTLPKGAAKPATIGGASTAEHKNVVAGNTRRVDASSPPTQGDHGPASFLLPQGLLEIYSKMSISSSPEGSRRMSLVDLILHGLLDPTPESISLYRDASLLANKINPSVNGRGSVTLNELLALGVLSGEEAGVAHRMPRAWIGGIADIDIENATSECFQFHSLDNGSATIDIERSSPVPVANSPERPITTSIFATPLLSAVSLHSQTVAVSLREQGGPQPDTLHRDVVDLQNQSENGYKRSVDELVDPEGENSGEPNRVELSAPKITRAHTTIPISHVSHNTLTTPTSPELSSQYHSGALKPTHSFIPPGAALPINPHLPNAYSTFPRHSVMFMKPASFAAPCLEQSTGASIESGVESHTDSTDSSLETDNDVEEVTDMNNEEESEHMSGSSLSSNPNLDGAVPLPSLSSPLLGSAHSGISGTIATSYIFSDEAEILPSQNYPTVTILAVSHSDETSAIIDPPPPTASLLLDPDPEQSMVISDVTDMLISNSIPLDSPNTSIASQSGIIQGLDLTHAMDTVNQPSRSRYSVHSDCSASPDAISLVVDRKRDSKLWLQRSPKSSGLMTALESPRRGYFSGIAAPEERRHSQVSLLEDNIPTASVSESPSTKGKFSSLPHIRIRRRSTVPKERPSTMHSEEGDAGGSEKKTKRLSRAISWMVTDIDDGPSQKLDMDDMVLEGDQRSKSGSPMKSFFTNLAASASSTSLLSFSDRGRRLSTSDISVQSGFANVDARASRVNSTLDTYPAPSPSAPALVVTPTHSPILSILSLPLNNLSNHSETPLRPALIISDSISSSACSTTSIFPPSVNAGIQQRLLASSSTNLARRHSNGAAPVGPRPSKRGGSLRTTSVVSSNSTKSTPSQSLRSESSRRPLPIPSPLPMSQSESQSELVSTSVSSSGIKEDEAENLITPFPAPLPTDSSNKDSESRSSTISRPQSRSGPSTSFSPLRKLAIDEVPLRAGIPRIAVAVSKASRPNSVAGVGNIGATNHSSKSKWKFWGNGGGRPVSMTVDLTREI